MRRALAAALILLLAAACQPLPHPFADNHPPPLSPMLSPPDAAGIVVAPVTGAPPVAAAALTNAMIAALRKDDIPADDRAANPRSYRLAGRVAEQDGSGHAHIAVRWRLTSAAGRPVGEAHAAGETRRIAWALGDDDFAERLAAEAAPVLARAVEGDVPVEHKIRKPAIAVAVAGAPGDGDPSLARAMAAVLHRAGFDLAATRRDKVDFRLAGRVAVGRPQGGKQEVKIVWVLSGATGGEIGRLRQANAVPAGSLDHAWGGTAYDVALAAAGGVVELIHRARIAAGS
ncbi:MAG: hypothetical protein ACREFD_16925 [Stellaceae bacterium]